MHAKVVRARNGFSLLELVVVIVIIGLIAAIAIPRFSRGAAGAAEKSLAADLSVLRNAIDLFAAEHGGKYPTLSKIADQLTKYSDSSHTSNPVDARDGTHPYGPYVRAIPPLPVGDNAGCTGFHDGEFGTAGFGWWYDQDTGVVQANCGGNERDVTGKKFKDY